MRIDVDRGSRPDGLLRDQVPCVVQGDAHGEEVVGVDSTLRRYSVRPPFGLARLVAVDPFLRPLVEVAREEVGAGLLEQGDEEAQVVQAEEDASE